MALLESYTYGGLDTSSWTHKVTGLAATYLLVGIRSNPTGGGVSAVTYGGVAMTRIYINEAALRYVYVYALGKPKLGPNIVSVTGGVSLECISACFGRVDQSDPYEDPLTDHSSTIDSSCSLTPGGTGHDLVVSFLIAPAITSMTSGTLIYQGSKIGCGFNWAGTAVAWDHDSTYHTHVAIVLNGIGTNTTQAARSPFYIY